MRVIPNGLQVGNVAAALEPSSSRYTLTADQLKQAIVASVRKAGGPGASSSASLELRATIVSQRNTKDRTLGSVEIRRQLIVTYELFDASKGQQVWRETYQSEFGSTTFGGNDAFNEAIEGSARENIKLMLDGLAAYFAR